MTLKQGIGSRHFIDLDKAEGVAAAFDDLNSAPKTQLFAGTPGGIPVVITVQGSYYRVNIDHSLDKRECFEYLNENVFGVASSNLLPVTEPYAHRLHDLHCHLDQKLSSLSHKYARVRHEAQYDVICEVILADSFFRFR